VVGADRAAVDRVERLRREVEALAAKLAEQAERQERLRSRLVAKRRQIESRLAAHRRYLKRLTRQVRKAVVQERRRQERLRRQALLRRLAAERAARARAAGGSWRAGIGRAGAPSGAAGRAVAFARSQLGKPYVWGASGPSSYDCSGLMMAAYRSAGVWLPRVSRAQFGAGPRVGLGSLALGDLVFFAYNTDNPGSIHHVGMYIGGGAMIEAPYSGASVRISSIGRRDYIGAVRPTG
jgi:peptidoglycan DL-endopeptidase CwlO